MQGFKIPKKTRSKEEKASQGMSRHSAKIVETIERVGLQKCIEHCIVQGKHRLPLCYRIRYMYPEERVSS